MTDNRVAYSPKEVAQMMGVSPKAIYDLLESGELHGIRVGRLWRIPATSLNQLLGAA